MKKSYRLLRAFFRQMNHLHVTIYASGAAFFTFLSLIPFLILLCSLLPYTPLTKSDLFYAVSFMPSTLVPYLVGMIESVYGSTIGIISISALVTVWSAAKGILSLMKGLNAVNGTVETRGYFLQRLVASFYTLIMLALILGSLLILVFGNVIMVFFCRMFPLWEDMMKIFVIFRPVLMWGLLTFFFVILYAYVPSGKRSLKCQMPGAIFCALSWNVFSFGFSVYIDHFNGLSIYGSLTAIAVVMIWLYFCMYLLLAGAHLNHFVCLYRWKS